MSTIRVSILFRCKTNCKKYTDTPYYEIISLIFLLENQKKYIKNRSYMYKVELVGSFCGCFDFTNLKRKRQ